MSRLDTSLDSEQVNWSVSIHGVCHVLGVTGYEPEPKPPDPTGGSSNVVRLVPKRKAIAPVANYNYQKARRAA